MVERLNGKVEAARAFEGGILLIYTSYEVVGSELESIDAEVRVSLGQSEGL
ncbi:hypothetical protein ALP29_201020 [Pseudomonas syringae pv. avii]|nr:hypothetical protein ALP29_201020 [Pseudomonas syringae pv. avii]